MADIKTNQIKLYKALQGIGFKDLGSEEDFSSKLQDANSRQKLYSAMQKRGFKDLGDYDSFEKRIYDGGADSEAHPVVDQQTQQGSYQPLTEEDKARAKEFGEAMMESHRMWKEQLDANSGRTKRMSFAPDPTMPFGTTPGVSRGRQKFNAETGKFEDTYMTQLGNEYASIIDAENEQKWTNYQKEQQRYLSNMKDLLGPLSDVFTEDQGEKSIDQRLQDAYNEVAWIENEIKAQPRVDVGLLTKQGKSKEEISAFQEKVNRNSFALDAALNEAKRRVIALEAERDDKGQSMFWRGTWDALQDPSVYSISMSDMSDMNAFNWIKNEVEQARKEGRKAQLTNGEKFLVRNYLLNQEAQQLNENRGDMYGYGKGFGHTIPFMAEMAVTGGLLAGVGKGFSRIGTAAGLRYLKSGVGRWMMKNMGTIPTKTVQYSLKGMGWIGGAGVGGAIQSNTIGGARTLSDIEKRHLGNLTLDKEGNISFEDAESLGHAILMGELTNIGENGSELLGGGFDFLPNILGRVIKRSAVGGALRKFTSNKAWRAGNKTLNYLGVQGVFGEGMEEEANSLFNAIIGESNWFKDPNDQNKPAFFDGKEQLDTWISVGLTSMILRGPQMAAGGYQQAKYYGYKYNLNGSDKQARELFGADRWSSIRSSIDESSNKDLGQTINSLLNDPNLSTEEKKAMMMYANDLVQMRGFNLSTMMSDANGVQGRARTDHYNVNGNTIEEVDAEGNVIETHEYEDEEALNAGLFELQQNRANQDMLNDIEAAKTFSNGFYDTFVSDFCTANEMMPEELDDMLNRAPLERTEDEQALVSQFSTMLHSMVYDESNLHIEQSTEDGQDVADAMSLDLNNPDGSKVNEVTASFEAAKAARDQLFENDEDFAQEVADRESKGLSPQEILSSLESFSDNKVKVLTNYYNQKARMEGMMDRLNQNIDAEASRGRERRTFQGTINGQADTQNLVVVSDGTNTYTLVSGNVTTDSETGSVTSSDSGLLIGIDENGDFVSLGDGSNYTIQPSGMTLDEWENGERARLQEQVSLVVDPNGEMMASQEDVASSDGYNGYNGVDGQNGVQSYLKQYGVIPLFNYGSMTGSLNLDGGVEAKRVAKKMLQMFKSSEDFQDLHDRMSSANIGTTVNNLSTIKDFFEAYKRGELSDQDVESLFSNSNGINATENKQMIGRPLTEQESDDLIASMEAKAVEDPGIGLTQEAWAQSFGINNSMQTPIGNVKMGEHQYQKLVEKNRTSEFGMVVQTLQDPDVVLIEPSHASEGQETERPYSLVFVKTFVRGGKKIKYYASVTVQRDNMEVSVSSHIMNANRVKDRLMTLERLYTKQALIPNSSDWHLAEQQNAVPDLLPTQGNNASSAGKGTENISTAQENEQKIADVTDKDGVKRYENGVDIDAAIADIQADGFDVNETADLAIAEAQVELDKIKAPKTRAEQVKSANKRAGLQKTIDYYTELKNRYNGVDGLNGVNSEENLNDGTEQIISDENVVPSQFSGTVEEQKQARIQALKAAYGELFDDDFTKANDVYELVSMWVGRKRNLAWDDVNGKRGLQKELGWTRKIGGDTRFIETLLAKKGEGMGVDEFAHMVWESPENDVNGEKRFDTQEIKDALLEMLRSAQSKSDVVDYALNTREAQARAAFEEQKRAAEEEAEAAQEDAGIEPMTADEIAEMEANLPFTQSTEEDIPDAPITLLSKEVDALMQQEGMPAIKLVDTDRMTDDEWYDIASGLYGGAFVSQEEIDTIRGNALEYGVVYNDNTGEIVVFSGSQTAEDVRNKINDLYEEITKFDSVQEEGRDNGRDDIVAGVEQESPQGESTEAPATEGATDADGEGRAGVSVDPYLQPRNEAEQQVIADVEGRLNEEIASAKADVQKAKNALEKAQAKESERATDMFSDDEAFREPDQVFGFDEMGGTDRSHAGVERRTSAEREALQEAENKLARLQSQAEHDSRVRGALDEERRQTSFDADPMAGIERNATRFREEEEAKNGKEDLASGYSEDLTENEEKLKYDRQGNLVDENGSLIIEKVASVDDVTDKDFKEPTRTIELPTLPVVVQNALSTDGRSVIIKKNIFERNAKRHTELTPSKSREILKAALYTPTLYGKNRPLSRPNNWILINVPDGEGNNRLVVLEINSQKDHVEIVHWHEIDNRGLEKIKKQAVREDGQLLILPSVKSEEAGALSSPTNGMLSAGKGTNISGNLQGNEAKNARKGLSEHKQRIRQRIDELTERLGTSERTTVVESLDDIEDAERRAHIERAHREGRKVYGWFENGKIFLFLPDIDSVYKAEQTIWHETVAHVGLRELLGAENYGKLLKRLWLEHKDKEMGRWVTKRMQSNGWSLEKAIDEWLAREAEKVVAEHQERRTLWQKLAGWVGDILREIGYRTSPTLTDVRYLFWLSENQLRAGEPMSAIKRAAFLHRLEREIENTDIRPLLEKSARVYNSASVRNMKNGLDAIKKIMEGADEVNSAMQREDLEDYGGTKDITFVFGKPGNSSKNYKGGFGLSHIGGKHGADSIVQMLDVIANGSIERYVEGNKTVVLSNGEYEAVLALTRNGQRQSWLLTGWEKLTTGENGKVSTSTVSTQTNPTFSREDLGAVVDSAAKVIQETEKSKDSTDFNNLDAGYSEDVDDEGSAENYSVKSVYHKLLDTVAFVSTEAFQDCMMSLKKLQDAMVKFGNVLDSQNAYQAYNLSFGKIKVEADWFKSKLYDPIVETGNKIKKLTGMSWNDIGRYVYTKHGLERNREFYVRDWLEKRRDKRKKAYNRLSNKIRFDFFTKKITEAERDEQLEKLKKNFENYNKRLDKKEQEWLDAKSAFDKMSMSDYFAILDNFIRKKIDKKYNPSEHDYSGFRAMFGDENGVYDEADVISELMDTEDKMEAKNVAELWEKIGAANEYMLERYRHGGMRTDEEIDNVKKMFNWYVPLRGFKEDVAEDVYQYFSSKGNPNDFVGHHLLKRAKGRRSEGKNPLSNIFVMGYQTIVDVNRNYVKQKFYRLCQANKNDIVVLSDSWAKYDDEKQEFVEHYPEIPEDASEEQVRQITLMFEQDMQRLAEEGKAKKIKGKVKFDYRPVNKSNISEHVVEVMVNGQKKRMTIIGNPRAAQAINGKLNYSSGDGTTPNDRLPKLWKKLQNLNRRILRMRQALSTNYSLKFVIKNAKRDFTHLSAILLTKEGPRYMAAAEKYYFQSIMGKNGMRQLFKRYREGKLDMSKEIDRDFKDFMDSGGLTGFVQMNNVDEVEKEIEKIQSQMDKNGFVKIGTSFWKCIPQIIESYNEAIENRARFATYRASRHYAGRTKERSAYDAKEVTANFNKHGAGKKTKGFISKNAKVQSAAWASGYASQILNENKMFFNATIQSEATILGDLVDNKWKFAGRYAGRLFARYAAIPFLLGSVGIPMLNMMIMTLIGGSDDDDDPYANLSEWDRRNNICIYIGKGFFIKMALGQELAAFYSLGDMAAGMRYYPTLRPVEKDWMDDVIGILGVFSPIDIDTKLANDNQEGFPAKLMAQIGRVYSNLEPWIAVANNVGWTGRPIYMQDTYPGDEDIPEYKRAYRSTGKGYVKLSEFLNWVGGGDDVKRGEDWSQLNPGQLEYLTEQYLGGPGRLIINTADAIGDGINFALGKDQDFNIRKIEMANAVFTQSDDRSKYYRTLAMFRKYEREADKLERTIKGYAKDAEANPDHYLKLYQLLKDDSVGVSRMSTLRELKHELEIKGIRKAMNETEGKERKDWQRMYNERIKYIVDELANIGDN